MGESTLLKNEKHKENEFENSKCAAQFPFPHFQNTFLVSNATPSIDFSLNMLVRGRVEPTIRIPVVTQPLNFLVFIRVESRFFLAYSEHFMNDLVV